jgi:hypothetical protein
MLYALNLSDIISKCCTAAMPVMIDSYTVFHTQCVGIFMLSLHTTFHMRPYKASLVNIVKERAKNRCHAANIFLLYNLQRENYLNKT